jgi:hypothetical protein
MLCRTVEQQTRRSVTAATARSNFAPLTFDTMPELSVRVASILCYFGRSWWNPPRGKNNPRAPTLSFLSFLLNT